MAGKDRPDSDEAGSPGRDDTGDVLACSGLSEQVIGTGEGDEALGVAGGLVDLAGVVERAARR